MNKATELLLQEWGRRVLITSMSIVPPTTNSSPKDRRQAALKNSMNVLDKKQESIETLSTYLDAIEKILEEEG